VLANLLEHLVRTTPAVHCSAAVPPGPIHRRLAEIEGVHVVEPTSRREWLDLALGPRQDWVVANSPRVLVYAVAAKWVARLRGAETRVAFVAHSNPSTRAKAAVLKLLARGVDAVVPVAASQWLPGRGVVVPPLGLRTKEILSPAEVQAGLNTRSRVVKAMGRSDRVKGLDVYLEAARHVHESSGLTFQLATAPGIEGDSAYEAFLAQSETAVERVGARNIEWIQPGDVVVVPSRDETACLLAQEAMARGAAVVASAVGDIAEYVVDGENGVLVHPDDPLALATALMELAQVGDAQYAQLCRAAHETMVARADGWYDSVTQILTARSAS
jgi:glycosyltransferase involved in cell wall biosynthesis